MGFLKPVKMTDSSKSTSLFYKGINYGRKKFYDTGPCGLYYKCFTFIIYTHNDSGQYYKITIMIVIDYPS